ncbi:MAG: MFS transporter [Alphaproteobacteria bacterium]|nr:MFS transporter [Alphaproteobacteria bacterium]
MSNSAQRQPTEGMLLFVLSAVQFVHIVDLMMVIPLGPDFARDLGIKLEQLGWVGGAYTMAASLAGLLAAVYLDRFDRKQLLVVCLSGLTLLTALGAAAWDFYSLVTIRFITGLFGGPCTAICFAIIADKVPSSRRGSAMGKVMAAFSLASIFGVPFGLELAHYFNWRAPFLATAGLTLLVLITVIVIMAPLTGHLSANARIRSFDTIKTLLFNKVHWQVFAVGSFSMFAAFLLIPHLASFVQFNLGLPRNELGLLYMAGGVGSFVVLRVVGKILNHVSAFIVSLVGMIVLVATCYAGMVHSPSYLSPLAIYVLFMASMSARGVCNNTLASKIPEPQQRAGFLALVNCIAQLFAALGAFLSTTMLHEASDKSLQGFSHVAMLAIAASLCVPLLILWVERHVTLRERAAQLIPPPESA